MLKSRVIAVVTLREGQVVQSVRFKHTNIIHYDAYHAVETFNRWSVDEIILVEDGKFHQVINNSEENLYFVCVFEGSRNH